LRILIWCRGFLATRSAKVEIAGRVLGLSGPVEPKEMTPLAANINLNTALLKFDGGNQRMMTTISSDRNSLAERPLVARKAICGRLAREPLRQAQ
jgi:hypothetical protein